MQNIKGVVIDVQEEKLRPSADKPVQINLSESSSNLNLAAEKILNYGPTFIWVHKYSR
ncbi:MAG: hypothetical protein ACR5KV_07765 [Wolbachia sp.]